jgi:DNA-binding transcriptional LysR family regulator
MHYRHAKQNIPIELLRTLVGLADVKNFTKVAQTLELTQPAVSAQIKRLQFLLGTDLFDKSAPGVVLTQAGEMVVRNARRLLDVNDQILQLARTGSHQTSLRIGTTPAFMKNILAHHVALIAECSQPLRLTSASTDQLIRDVGQGYLDIAIALSESRDGAVVTWPERLVWAKAPQFVMDRTRPLPIIRNPNTLTDRMSVGTLDRNNVPYNTVFVADDTSTFASAVAAGIGIGALPGRLLSPELIAVEFGILPMMPPTYGGIHVRDGIDTELLKPLINGLLSVLDVAPADLPNSVDAAIVWSVAPAAQYAAQHLQSAAK